jgi:uncharacterized YigZ family protein
MSLSDPDMYKTISAPSTGLFKDKGSKFLAFAYPISDEKDSKNYLSELRKTYFDARHHCFAYMIGADKKQFRAFDDGEPSGTAGKPILGQIQSRNLTNILIVVVRYFGGTLLGTSGLINAYRSSAADALDNSNIIEKTINHIFLLSFDYNVMNDVMKITKDESVTQLSHKFDLQCTMEISVREALSDALRKKMDLIENLKYDLIRIE